MKGYFPGSEHDELRRGPQMSSALLLKVILKKSKSANEERLVLIHTGHRRVGMAPHSVENNVVGKTISCNMYNF